jgi:hypothetical protein
MKDKQYLEGNSTSGMKRPDGFRVEERKVNKKKKKRGKEKEPTGTCFSHNLPLIVMRKSSIIPTCNVALKD